MMKCDAVQYNLNPARGNSDASPSCIATLAGFFIGDNAMKIKLKCQQCSREFERIPSYLKRHAGSGKYCSRQCSDNNHHKYSKIVVKCKTCQNEFTTTTNRIRDSRGVYCCVKCRRKSQSAMISGGNHHNWKGIKKTSTGYIIICIGGGEYIPLQRLLMEWKLGRKLNEDELVHHVNGIKTDNRIENLEVTTITEHARFHTTKRHKEGVFYEF